MQIPDQIGAELPAERLAPRGARRRLAFAAIGTCTTGRSAADGNDVLAEGFGRDE